MRAFGLGLLSMLVLATVAGFALDGMNQSTVERSLELRSVRM